MTIEYGLFSDEGLIEGNFYSLEEATEALAKSDPDDELQVFEICPEHPDQTRNHCEECDAEEEGDEDA
ncbi:MAG: hypothetical protein K2R98_19335 [Gemmataceae bacterium]|nr:hypothetical protein [Gemmataceae bacterium]